MKLALLICPYFTNGDWPPLGIAAINGALREAGHETVVFDLNHQVLVGGDLTVLHLLRQLVRVGKVRDEVVFGLEPMLLLSFLYRHDYPGFAWQNRIDPADKAAEAMLYLGVKTETARQAELILKEKPEAVLCSTFVSNLLWTVMLARELKRRAPDLPVILGGPGVGLPEVGRLVLELGVADALVVGEGEVTAQELARDLDAALHGSVPGVAVRRDGDYVLEPRGQVPLANLPAPSFTGLPGPGLELSAYQSARGNPFQNSFFLGLPVSMTRGCVNRCAYCTETAYWNGYRVREAAAVFADLKRLAAETGERKFIFGDSSVNGHPRRLRELLHALIEADLSLELSAYMIAGPELTEDLVREAWRAGLRYVTLGIETFSAGIRERINKRGRAEQLIAAAGTLVRAGMAVRTHLLVGFPGESEAEFEESLEMIERWRARPESERGPGRLYWSAGHVVRLEAYSDLYHHPERYGIEIEPAEAPPLPSGLDHLRPALEPLFKRWRAAGRDGLDERSARMAKAAGDDYYPG